VIARSLWTVAVVLLIAGCTSGSSSTFSPNSASVDSSYSCPVGASNVHYDLHGTIDVHNGTSKAVSISSVDATLTLAAVKGAWLQKVAAGANATLVVTIPTACTGRAATSPVASGDYVVGFTMITSAGTFKLDSKDRHRISTG